MPLANLNGIRLFYEINGSGYPLVFCHEFAGDYRSWDLQVGYFSRSYNVITYCARGYPPSDVPDAVADYSQEQSVEDLKDLLVYLDVDRAHIVGLSMGGNVALNFVLTYPEMVSSMVLAGTGTGSDEPDAFTKRVAWIPWRSMFMGLQECNYKKNPLKLLTCFKSNLWNTHP